MAATPPEKKIILNFTEYECAPFEDRILDEERCFHAPNGRWVNTEEMNDEFIGPAFQQIYAMLQPGDTFRITLEVRTPKSRKKRSDAEDLEQAEQD